MKKAILVLALFLTASAGFAAEPNSWHGLTLDVSTYDDIVNTLGKPDKIKTGEKLYSMFRERLDDKLRYRTLEYKNKFEIDSAKLYLQLDRSTNTEVLRAISIDLKEKIDPNILDSLYDSEFSLSVSGLAKQGTARGRIPSQYHLLTITDTSMIDALVNRGTGLGQMFGELSGVPDDGTSWPGKVEAVLLISGGALDTKGISVLE